MGTVTDSFAGRRYDAPVVWKSQCLMLAALIVGCGGTTTHDVVQREKPTAGASGRESTTGGASGVDAGTGELGGSGTVASGGGMDRRQRGFRAVGR